MSSPAFNTVHVVCNAHVYIVFTMKHANITCIVELR